MTRARLKFDPDGHRFWLNGVRVPSVTQVIETIIDPDGWAGIHPLIIERAAQKGRIVHRLLERTDRGERFTEKNTHPKWLAYCNEWLAVKTHYGLRPILIEEPLCHVGLHYAGILDRLTYDRDHRLVLLDIKTGTKRPGPHLIQLAGYDQLLKSQLQIAPAAWWTLYFEETEEGRVESRLVSHNALEVSKAFNAFSNALAVYYIRLRYNLLKEEPHAA